MAPDGTLPTPSTSADQSIRPIAESEFDIFGNVLDLAFNQAPNEELRRHEASLMEYDRTLGAFDGAELIGTAAVYSFDMTVPGGVVPTAGVTWVSVLPTHRRRGTLGRLMRRQIDDVHAAGREPIAALWASEAPIYGRYGYGPASASITITVPRMANSLRPVDGAADLRVRFVDNDAGLDLVQAVYDHERARRPGMVAINDAWRRDQILDLPSQRKGNTMLRTVVVDGPDGVGAPGVRAFARYAVQSEWDGTGAKGTVHVRVAMAADPAAAWALWRHLTDVDLTAKTSVRTIPVDDPLLSLLMNPRASTRSLSDDLYVRMVDVGGALAARTYAAPVDVVIDVADPMCPWNERRWRLSGDPTGARCEPTSDAPDLSIAVRELGASYLGGTSLIELAAAGQVEEHTSGAVAELALALLHQPAPWSPFVF